MRTYEDLQNILNFLNVRVFRMEEEYFISIAQKKVCEVEITKLKKIMRIFIIIFFILLPILIILFFF